MCKSPCPGVLLMSSMRIPIFTGLSGSTDLAVVIPVPRLGVNKYDQVPRTGYCPVLDGADCVRVSLGVPGFPL